MSALYLICGLPGSGKTALAKELEMSAMAIRFCPDEWISMIIEDKSNKKELDRLREPVERLLWDLAKKILISGMDVILEYGFWSKEERLEFLRGAKQVNTEIKVILHYLDVPIEKLWERIQKRNNKLPKDCFPITQKELDQWMSWFIPPDQEELKLYDGHEMHNIC